MRTSARRSIAWWIVVVLTATILCPTLLAGCSSSSSSSEEPTPSTEQQVELHDLEWPASGLAAMLPTPSSPYGYVSENSHSELSAIIEAVDQGAFETYAQECVASGFSVDLEQGETSLSAENADGYTLELAFSPSASTMSIMASEPRYEVAITVDCAENLLFSRYGLDVYLDGSPLGSVAHGAEETFEEELPAGTYMLEVESDEDSDVCGFLEFEVAGDREIAVKARCTSSAVSLELAGAKEPQAQESEDSEPVLAKNEVAVPFGSSKYAGEPYKKALRALERAGFTNVVAKPVYDLSDPNRSLFSFGVNEVEEVTIAGDSFSKGDVFKKGAKAVVRYHKLECDNPKVKWKTCTVAELFDDLDANAMRAKKAYEGNFLVLTGYVDTIDASGNYVDIAPSDSGWDFNTIRLDLSTDAQQSKVEKMSRGDRVTAKIKVDAVGELISYQVTFYRFA